ncbi:cysteine synthase [Dendrobium catenatum]|uniref:Cysteine synthase n=1 Tax=Dendrobium catenatum TaxID=906689 RepID=A0A2I0X372_9ASPA|nr:cysteine synthase [Dendrobium catenatum]PKU82364.1 Cysteine synthase [Dendrobium catenatum]
MEQRRGLPSFISSHEEERENIASDIIQLIGWTPLIELKRIVEKEGLHIRLVGKLESYQPLCSVKDRGALRMIEDAEEKGLIKPGINTLVGPTSGNLGISFAFIAIRKGYKFLAIMPANYSVERRMLLRYLGAQVLLTDPKLGIKAIYTTVDQLKEKDPNIFVLDQTTNPANPEAHFLSTGPEIWKDTAGKVDIFVCGSGSGGTISGAARFLKMKNPAIKIICVEPAESAVISGGQPGPHNIQGLGPGFVPEILDTSQIDEIITVTTAEAMTQARRLALEEGLVMGISSGACLAASLKIGKREENKGKMIVTVFASAGERYLSTELFEEIREECINMTF